jgi:hypothetical protein
MVSLFEEIENLPTTSLIQVQTHSPSLPSRFGPCSPSSIFKSSPHTPNLKPTPEEQQLVQERDDALRKNVYLQKRLDQAQEKQERTSKRLADTQQQLDEALEEVDRLRAFMKKKGESLIQGSMERH